MKYLLTLLLFSTTLLQSQNSDVWNYLREGWRITSPLHNYETKPLTPALMDELTRKLIDLDLKTGGGNMVQFGNHSFQFESSPNIHFYQSPDQSASLYIEAFQNKNDLDNRWTAFRKWKGVFSGYSSSSYAYYYLKLDTLFNVSMNAGFRTDKLFISIQKKLPFYAVNLDSLTENQWLQIDKANTYLLNIIHTLREHIIYDKDKIYFPSNGRIFHRVLTPVERLAGFIHFWTEVKYNFAFFDHVPELDWDQILLEYLPRVQADQTNFEYYTLLAEICARLKDGHTNIYPPEDLESNKYYPMVDIGNLDGKIYVLNTSELYRNLLPIGSEIVKVNGESISNYLQNNLYPYISASTEYIKQKIALQNLLEIPANAEKNLTIEFITPTGVQNRYEFQNEKDTTSWIKDWPAWRPVDFSILKDRVAWLKINTFERQEVVSEFLKFKDSIAVARKLIIDLRENGGGNSEYGYEILKYFSKKPFLTSKWMTREHKASYKAWGQFITDPPAANSFEEECLLTLKGNYWHKSPPDTIEPYYDQHIAIPVVILIGNNTASAAEDFLVAAEGIGLTETVGDLTFGSTGQPLLINLPGGGSARICSKRDTYPDGKEFVGFGIKPKYLVKPNLQDFLENRDKVLAFALDLKL